jgi:hypothetical protein
MALYLMCVYGHEPLAKWFREAWTKTGKKLDMGKSCIRFKKVEDLALDVIGEVIRRVPAKKYLEHYEAAIRAMKARGKNSSTKTNSKISRNRSRQ